MTLHKDGRETTLGYIEGGAYGYKRRLRVTAELSLVDDLNDHEREKETTEHERIRYGDVPHISITWGVWKTWPSNDRMVAGGAGIDADILSELPERAQRIHELAERWHLSAMRAGCVHQETRQRTGRWGKESYGDPEDCPETGYRWGSAWLVEVPPEEVVQELRELFGLAARCYSDHNEDIRTKGSCDFCRGTEPDASIVAEPEPSR